MKGSVLNVHMLPDGQHVIHTLELPPRLEHYPGQEMVALLGASDLGKTTLLQACLTHHERPYRIIAIRAAHITFAELLQQIAQAVGIADATKHLTEPLDEIRGRLLQEAAQSRPVVLIIDNAHEMPTATLKHLPRHVSSSSARHSPLPLAPD